MATAIEYAMMAGRAYQITREKIIGFRSQKGGRMEWRGQCYGAPAKNGKNHFS